MSIDVSTIATPDPKAALRRQRQQARMAAVTHEAVIETLVQSVRDTCEHLPEDCWSLDRPTPQGPVVSPSGRDRDRLDEGGGRSLVVRR